MRSTIAPPVAAAESTRHYRLHWLRRLSYPVRTVVRRWRGMLGMMIGVGLALSLTMTIVAVSQGTQALMTDDFLRSGIDLYLYTKGSKPIAVLAGETPDVLMVVTYFHTTEGFEGRSREIAERLQRELSQRTRVPA